MTMAKTGGERRKPDLTTELYVLTASHYKVEIRMALVHCPTCGCPFGIPEPFYFQLHPVTDDDLDEAITGDDDDVPAMHCPNGHKLWPGQSLHAKMAECIRGESEDRSVSSKLNRELARSKHRCEQLEAEVSELKAKE